MSEQAAQPHDPGQQAADAQYYRHALHGLIDMGTDLARALHGQATAQAAPQPLASQAATAQPALAPATLIGIATAFDKVARTIRRCIMLAQHVAQPAPDPAWQRTAARKRILRDVEDTIQRPTDGAERPDAGALQAELRERLDAPDLEEDLRDRPVPDIIQDICRDLGLAANPGTRPWKRRTPQDLADLYARATAPSHPHAPGPAPRAPGCGSTPAHATPATPASAADPCPLAAPNIQQVRTRTCDDPPPDPAGLIAAILRHPVSFQDRWHPPPSG